MFSVFLRPLSELGLHEGVAHDADTDLQLARVGAKLLEGVLHLDNRRRVGHDRGTLLHVSFDDLQLLLNVLQFDLEVHDDLVQLRVFFLHLLELALLLPIIEGAGVELGVDESLLVPNPTEGTRKLLRQLVQLRLRRRKLRLDDLLVPSGLRQVRPPLLRIVRNRDLELRGDAFHLQKPRVRVHGGLHDPVVLLVTVVVLLHLVLLIHQVILLDVATRHLVLADRMDLRVAVHFGFVRKGLVGIHGRAPLEIRPAQHLAKEALEDEAHAVTPALLQFTRHHVHRESKVFQDHEHVRNHGVWVIVLVPVSLLLDHRQQPDDELREVLELGGRVSGRIREECTRHRLHLLVAKPILVVQQHEHVDELIVQLQRLRVVGRTLGLSCRHMLQQA
mmetsp:Transcript_112788/g.318885  ORF Transcript_112788/g.318885 Transcript_112788/m.318885 type:complete len:390 (+) Transcript_112788:257-1426(+)